jgi:hypothetical protein
MVGDLSSIHILAVVSNAIISMGMQLQLLYADMDSFGYISRIAGFYGNSIFSF